MKKFLILLLMITTCSISYAYEFNTSDYLREQREEFNKTMEYNQRASQIEKLHNIQTQLEQQNSYQPTRRYDSYEDSYSRPTYVQEKPLYKFGNSSEL